MSWRYAIKAEPYNTTDDDAKKLFLKTIKHIIDMNRDFRKCIEADYGDQQSMPENTIKIHQLPLNKRLGIYHEYKIIEQRD
ncbi:MAG: hypothetical protein LBI78_02645 [Campylobacteraceae bacterium]|nr:hypothetical protein [Campylobacteraceae bacterium]